MLFCWKSDVLYNEFDSFLSRVGQILWFLWDAACLIACRRRRGCGSSRLVLSPRYLRFSLLKVIVFLENCLLFCVYGAKHAPKWLSSMSGNFKKNGWFEELGWFWGLFWSSLEAPTTPPLTCSSLPTGCWNGRISIWSRFHQLVDTFKDFPRAYRAFHLFFWECSYSIWYRFESPNLTLQITCL